MKKIILAVTLLLVLFSSLQARADKIPSQLNRRVTTEVITTCLDGYEWKTFTLWNGADAVAMEAKQVFKHADQRDWPPQPVRCK